MCVVLSTVKSILWLPVEETFAQKTWPLLIILLNLIFKHFWDWIAERLTRCKKIYLCASKFFFVAGCFGWCCWESFVLPGKCPANSTMHHLRLVCGGSWVVFPWVLSCDDHSLVVLLVPNCQMTRIAYWVDLFGRHFAINVFFFTNEAILALTSKSLEKLEGLQRLSTWCWPFCT